MKKSRLNYWVDVATGIAFVACCVTGVVRLFPAAASLSNAGTATVLGVSAVLWTTIHDWSGVAAAVGVGIHLALHLRWLVTMTRRLLHRSRPQRRPAVAEAAGAIQGVSAASVQVQAVQTRDEAETRLDRRAFLMHAGALGGAALLLGLTLTGCDQGDSSSSSSSSKVTVDASRCTGCADCVRACSHGVLAMDGSTAVAQSPASCTLCGDCAQACKAGAISLNE